MEVFISWSGDRSKYLAGVLRLWLRDVIQDLRPWMSDHDIPSGARWHAEVSERLSKVNFGIICVTPENQAKPWLLFEAGALSKTLADTYVCPLLFDFDKSQVTGPLTHFQLETWGREGVTRIVQTLNKALPEPLPEEVLSKSLDKWWPDLAASIERVPAAESPPPERRTPEDMLSEVLVVVREQLRRETARSQAADVAFDPRQLTRPVVRAYMAMSEGVTVDMHRAMVARLIDSLERRDEAGVEPWSSLIALFKRTLEGIDRNAKASETA